MSNADHSSIEHAEQMEEQRYVDHVVERISAVEAELAKNSLSIRDEVIEIRRNFWDDVTINIGNTDDLAETHFAIRQQAEVLAERERRYSHTASALKVLRKQMGSPFFARIDFREQGHSDIERVYIGIGSFRDDAHDEFLVYDWRAPISSLYYDHTPGPVSFTAPLGTVDGEMTLKRQFVIRDAVIQVMFDAALTIGDELLMYALGRHSDSQMRSIVATIQREQNRIIRNDVAQVLVVQGAAGSGKTSAVLQRAAYLLYKHRGDLTTEGMLLLSPNPMFSSFVSTVLPELGEENIEQTTFGDYLEHRLKREFDVEDGFDHLESLLTETREEVRHLREQAAQLKASLHFVEALQSYVGRLENEGMRFLPIRFRGETMLSGNAIRAAFLETGEHLRLPQRMDALKKWVLQQIDAFVDREIHAEWVEDEIELMDPEDYQKAHNQVMRRSAQLEATFDDYDAEKEVLARMVLSRQLKKTRSRVKKLAFVDTRGMYRRWYEDEDAFVRQFPDFDEDDLRRICRDTVRRLRERQLSYEDATPYLYLKDLILGQTVNTSVRHLFIDEAQDYSILQLEVIHRLFPRSRLTILGDVNQSVYAHRPGMLEVIAPAVADGAVAAANHADNARQPFDGDLRTETITLNRSYRSTAEIVRFTKGMTQRGENIVPFERSGPIPRVIQVTQGEQAEVIRQTAQSFQERGYASIAMICKTQREADDLHRRVAHMMAARRIDKHTGAFSQGVVVIPAYLAKGVEFDAVVVADGSEVTYARDMERELFYTACTRAMHELCVVTVGKPNRWVTDQPNETYQFIE